MLKCIENYVYNYGKYKNITAFFVISLKTKMYYDKLFDNNYVKYIRVF